MSFLRVFYLFLPLLEPFLQHGLCNQSQGRYQDICFSKAQSPATLLAMGPAEIWSLPPSRSPTAPCSLTFWDHFLWNMRQLGICPWKFHWNVVPETWLYQVTSGLNDCCSCQWLANCKVILQPTAANLQGLTGGGLSETATRSRSLQISSYPESERSHESRRFGATNRGQPSHRKFNC